MRRPRQRNRIRRIDEFRMPRPGALDRNRRRFQHLVGCVETDAPRLAAVQERHERLAEQRGYPVRPDPVAGVDVLLDEHRAQSAGMIRGIVLRCDVADALRPHQLDAAAMRRCRDIGGLEDDERTPLGGVEF